MTHVTKTLRTGIMLAAVATAMPFVVSTAWAQSNYPTRPIRLVVPFPPGGGTDILARVIGQQLSKSLGQSVVVENKPGAGGNIGVETAAKSSPDGYTLVIGQTSNLAINPTLYPNLPYNPIEDLAPISLVASAPLVMVVTASSPFKSLADVVTAARAKPDDVMFGSPGSGTVSHLSGELLQRAANIKFLHIPYKGASLAMADLMGGRLQLYMSSVPSALAQLKGGRLRALAVTSAKRLAGLPDVPTVAESGFKDFETSTWFGLLARAGTPQPIISRLNSDVDRALQTAEVRDKIASEGAEVLGGTPAQFADLLKRELEKWSRVVRESGAKVE
jgi:tripartite-type tricarboxylate transporter receptor subunit TctC